MSELSEKLKDILDAGEEKDESMVDSLTKLKCKDNTVFLALIAPYVGVKISPSKYASASLGTSEEFGVESLIEEIKSKTECRNLVLLINSPGGFVGASYKIARALRENFDNIVVFVPHVAASGGTLISLAGNTIVMGMMSQLSPIDPSTENLPSQSVVRGFKYVCEYFKDKNEDDAPYPYRVLAEKQNPATLDEAISSLSLMVKYAKEILLMGKLKESEADKIAKKLVGGYLIHEEVINFNEAKNIGLNIKSNIDYKEEWEAMRKWLGKYLLQSSDKHIIRYFISNECKIKEAKNEGNK